MDTIEEMKMAADLTAHEHFMGVCEGGFPLIAFDYECRFCGAIFDEKCKRCLTQQDTVKP